MTKRISVLMTCHNRKEKTLRCLRSIETGVDIFLVDDGSTDGTGAAVIAEFPHVKIIKGSGSLYWARGMRLAWDEAEKRSEYDFYLWLNDDVALKKDAIEAAVEDWRSIGREDAVVVGACEYEGVCTYGATDAADQKIVPNGSPQLAGGWLNGNFVLVSNKAYEKVGKISGDYTHARADYDYAERLKRAGVPFYVTSKYVGTCPYDFESKVRGKGLMERISWLWRPGYFNLHDLWLIRSRYHGRVRAIVSCLHLIQIVLKGWK